LLQTDFRSADASRVGKQRPVLGRRGVVAQRAAREQEPQRRVDAQCLQAHRIAGSLVGQIAPVAGHVEDDDRHP
jgi:hypothetical protein